MSLRSKLIGGLIALAVLPAAARELAPDAVSLSAQRIDKPLTERPGDAQAGRAAFIDRQGAHCLLCHRVASLDAPFQGTLGPDLSRFGERMDWGLTRLRMVDATRLNPDTVMPAYYRVRELRQVANAYRGQPVLNAQQVEDILAFLASLTEE